MIIEEQEVRARLVLALKEARIDPDRLLEVLAGVSLKIKGDIGSTPGDTTLAYDWITAMDAQQPIEDLAAMLSEMKEDELF